MQSARKEKVGYLGAATPDSHDTTTFGYMAAEKHFASHLDEVEFVSFPSHPAICEAVGKKKIRFGVVAAENVADGIVHEVVQTLEEANRHYGVHIAAEVVQPIEMLYLGKCADIVLPVRLLSKDVALRQCKRFVESLHARGVVTEYTTSTGDAARLASQDATIACLASSRAEQEYGLERIGGSGNVADSPNNMTRFWVLNKEYGDRSGQDKSCFLINLQQNQPGALCRALEYFARHGCNLLIVYPIPIPGKPWEYTFLVEFEGHIDDEAIDSSWQELHNSGLCLSGPTFLGSYPSVASNIHVLA